MRIIERCPTCNKRIVNPDISEGFGSIWITGSCGHTFLERLEEIPLYRDKYWDKLYEFQRKGIEFIEKSNYNALLLDEQGLGKTIQSLVALRYNTNLFPVLVICSASLTVNWKKEWLQWMQPITLQNAAMIHRNGTITPIEGLGAYIVSMDLIYRPKVLKFLKEYPFKTVVIDEVHNFKNPDSERSKALLQIVPHIPHRISLSGTPILNRFMEYFIPLHLTKPAEWPTLRSLQYYAHYDWSTRKYLGIRPGAEKQFFTATSDYLIRRLKKDVLQDLPELCLYDVSVDLLTDSRFVNAYNKHLDTLEELLDDYKKASGTMLGRLYGNILAVMAQLIHLTGIGKLPAIFEHVLTFLESTENQKICVGVHHHVVGERLQSSLLDAGYSAPYVSGMDSTEAKWEKVELFKKPENRVLIASIEAMREGWNLQFCSNAVIAERRWNPSREGQFIGRFHRIGQTRGVIVDRLTATDTIDEFLDSLVRLKQQITDQSVDFLTWEGSTDMILELAKLCLAHRLKYVGV